MARLPVPGGDDEVWSRILNEYLLVSHNQDGTQKNQSVGAAALQDKSVGMRHLNTTNPSADPLKNMVLSNDGSELVWRTSDAVIAASRNMEFYVVAFGAKGDGKTDDTNAIQAAIDAAVGGGSIIFPRGVFMVRGLKIRRHGIMLTGSARLGTRLVRLSGDAPLVDISGTGSINNHIKYCSLSNIMLSGNNKPGVLLRSYFADNCVFREVCFTHCDGLATDIVEVWDTRFQACSWEDCGSLSEPATLLRNTMPKGQFGYGTDNTNQIHFHSCRWESFCNGAIRLDGAANDSPHRLNGIFFVSCKMETRHIGGSAFQIMQGTTIVFVTQLYMAIMGRHHAYNEAVDAIEDHGTQVFVTDVYVQWGPAKGLARYVLHIWEGEPHTYQQISSFFPADEPLLAFSMTEPPARRVMLLGLWANKRRRVLGKFAGITIGGPGFGYYYPIDTTGVFRIMALGGGKDIFRVDNNPSRQVVAVVNSADAVGFASDHTNETWRIAGSTGAARFAGGKFSIEPSKGYVGINTAPFTGLALLIRLQENTDRGIAIVRASATATKRLMEFQDETNQLQGMAIDHHGRPVSVGTPARVAPGDQVSYANPDPQVRDIAGMVVAAVRPSPTAPGTIATVTFSKPYTSTPLSITINNHSAEAAELYVAERSTTGFTVATRRALPGGAIIQFDYSVVA